MAITRNSINIITITETLADDYVTVSVSDHGSGIDDEIREKLFEPFVTTRKEGSGVGLAVSRQIIEDHHGQDMG